MAPNGFRILPMRRASRCRIFVPRGTKIINRDAGLRGANSCPGWDKNSRDARAPLLCVAALLVLTQVSRAVEPVVFTVSFPSPSNHVAEVRATYPTDGRPAIEL